MTPRIAPKSTAKAITAILGLLLVVGLASCGGQGGDEDRPQPPPELEAELRQDVSLLVLQPQDFGPTHRCDPTVSPGLAPGEMVEWCMRTPPAQAEGEEACVLSGAFLFPQIADAERFYTDFEADRRLDLARQDGLAVSKDPAPQLGDEAVLHTLTAASTNLCGLAGAPANAIWISIRKGKVVLRFELWALGQTASADEALDLAAKQLARADAVPTLQPSQMLLHLSDLPAGFAPGRDVPIGLWGRATAFLNEDEGLAIGSFAVPFRTEGEAAAALSAIQLHELPGLALGDAVSAPVEPKEEAPPASTVGDTARALTGSSNGQEVYVVAFSRGPGLAAVVSLADADRFSLQDVVELALRADRRIQQALE